MRLGVVGGVLVSEHSMASGACSGAAEKLSDLQDAFPNHPVFPRLCRPQLKMGVPALHVERQ
jgi:hypothetical protein